MLFVFHLIFYHIHVFIISGYCHLLLKVSFCKLCFSRNKLAKEIRRNMLNIKYFNLYPFYHRCFHHAFLFRRIKFFLKQADMCEFKENCPEDLSYSLGFRMMKSLYAICFSAKVVFI